MGKVRVSTAGESHGPAEICLLEGIPSGLALRREDVDVDLRRRQQGYGRGGRMAIEADKCRFLAGVRRGRTLGTPLCLLVENKDHENWLSLMSPEPATDFESQHGARVTVPRPGHADLGGLCKYGYDDIRNVLERASARETVGRVAAGAVCKRLLSELGVRVRGRVTRIGTAALETSGDFTKAESIDWEAVEVSPVACDDAVTTAAMCEQIEWAREEGESLGGVFEIWCWGIVPGLGGYARSQDRLDGALMGAMGSIPAVKAAEIGEGFLNASRIGSHVHDPLFVEADGRQPRGTRRTNRAAGIEGGITTGLPVVIRAAMKPIPTLTTPLPSVDMATLENTLAHVERSDVAAVPAARVVGEAMAAIVLADAYLNKFGCDSLDQLLTALRAHEDMLEERGLWYRS